MVLPHRVRVFFLFRLRQYSKAYRMQRSTPCLRIDRCLDRHLIRRALFQESARAGIKALGVLPDHHEIDVLRALVLKRGLHAGVKLYRAQIDVLVQRETNGEQKAFFQDSRLDIRVADGAEKDGIELRSVSNAPSGSTIPVFL